MRKIFARFCACSAALSIAAAACAAESVRVEDAWVRAPAPGQKTAAAYVQLTAERDSTLVAAGSSAASRVELHSMTMEGGVMRMRPLSSVALPAGRTVKLAPGSTHLMLIDLKQPLKAGDKVPLVLSVQSAGPAAGSSLTTIKLEAEVRAAAAGATHAH